MNDDHEEWRKIVDFPKYSVSSLGRIRRDAKGNGAIVGLILKKKPHWNGYDIVGLYHEGMAKTPSVHSLVAAAFIGPRPAKHDVCHNNGDRKDNRAVNLRYATRKENELDKYKHGTDRRSRPIGAKITKDDVVEIRRLSALGVKNTELAARYGLKQPSVSNIVTRKNWAHVQ